MRNKMYTAITIIGFSVSLMFTILLSSYIKQEYSVDRFHKNKDRVYRLVHGEYSGFAPPSGPLLLDKFPEMESYTRTFTRDGFSSVNQTEKLPIDFLMVDSTFFKMFSFNLIKGNTQTALLPKSIVLTETYALKLFGKIPDLGQIVTINNEVDYKVSGIMKDIPENSHFDKVDAIVDFPSLKDLWQSPEVLTSYGNNSFGLYVMAKPNSNFTKKAPEILKLFKEVNWMFQRGYANQIIFEPLTDIYFGTAYTPGIKQNSKRLLLILSAIVVMILTLSVLNYINLTIAQSGTRSKEIAVKKIMGSKKGKIIFQYIFESVLLTLTSFIIALLFSFSIEPIFNNLLNTNLNLNTSLDWNFITYAIGISILIGIISGIIPALAISNFDPISIVKGTFRMKNKSVYSKALITFQYFIIVVLIISAMFINKQTTFLRNYDVGFNKDNILIIDNTIENKQRSAFKSKLEEIPGVEHICYVAGNPIDGGNNNSFEHNGKQLSFQTFVVDTSFFSMMNMPVTLTGVALTQDAILINETAIKALELSENPTSAKIYGTPSPLYGIVKDFHFRDLKEKVGPAYFRLLDNDTYAWSIMIKISPQNTFKTTQKIKTAYHDFTNGLPIDIKFMDDSINQWYNNEERIGKLIKYFSILTIIISVMGLFAMSMYYVQQKTKEIGVRKVNGAKTLEVMLMLNRNFIIWVFIAFTIASPIAYYILKEWLENFAYKTELSWWIFALSGILALSIAIATVSWQSWRAATKNPVDILRCE